MIQVRRVSPAETVDAVDALDGLYHRRPATADRMEVMLGDPSFVLLLAHSDDECAGYLHAELLSRLDGERMLLVYDIAVDPEHRRMGVGTELMKFALGIAREAAARCWLVTEPDNSAARALYEKLGGNEWSATGFGWTLE